jgi:hypothetical protein
MALHLAVAAIAKVVAAHAAPETSGAVHNIVTPPDPAPPARAVTGIHAPETSTTVKVGPDFAPMRLGVEVSLVKVGPDIAVVRLGPDSALISEDQRSENQKDDAAELQRARTKLRLDAQRLEKLRRQLKTQASRKGR